MLFNASYNRPESVRRLVPGAGDGASSYRRGLVEAGRAGGRDLLSRVSLLDQETFLLGILNRQDKMSMAASIESRVPFMDYRLVEFANSLPGRHKVAGGQGKALVKDVARTYLPDDVVFRRKSGFGVPLPAWFRQTTGLGALLRALPDAPRADLFDRAALKQTVDAHVQGVADHSELLWTALNVVAWRDAFRC